MTRRLPRPSAVLLLLIPALALISGAVAGLVSPGQVNASQGAILIAILAPALAPLGAALLLWRVAPGFDVVLLASAAMQTGIGTVALFLLTTQPGPNQDFYAAIATRHGIFVALGFAGMAVGAVLARRLDLVRRYPYTLMLAALLLTAVTILFGETVNGARLWLHVGPLQFQPSEIARLMLVGFVAIYLYDRRHLVAAAWRVGPFDLPPAPYLLPVAAAVLAAVGVLVLQNDLGMAALIALGVFATVAAVLQRGSATALAAGLLALAATGAYVMVPRVRDRVLAWLDPWHDPMGRGFQFVRSEFALAEGGIAGRIARNTTVPVPEVHTDFILVAIGAQFGILAAAAILTLSAVVVLRCVIIALRAGQGLGGLLAFSLAVLFGIQVILIVGGTLRVLPLTGLTFPLVSYGGTSLLATLFALGLVLGIGSCRPGNV